MSAERVGFGSPSLTFQHWHCLELLDVVNSTLPEDLEIADLIDGDRGNGWCESALGADACDSRSPGGVACLNDQPDEHGFLGPVMLACDETDELLGGDA